MPRVFTLFGYPASNLSIERYDYDNLAGFGPESVFFSGLPAVSFSGAFNEEVFVAFPNGFGSQTEQLCSAEGGDPAGPRHHVQTATLMTTISVTGYPDAYVLNSPVEWLGNSYLVFYENLGNTALQVPYSTGRVAVSTDGGTNYEEIDALNAVVPGYTLWSCDWYTAESTGVLPLLYIETVVFNGTGMSGGTNALLRECHLPAGYSATHDLLDLTTLDIQNYGSWPNCGPASAPLNQRIPVIYSVLPNGNAAVAVLAAGDFGFPVWSQLGPPTRFYLSLLNSGTWSSDTTGWLPLDSGPMQPTTSQPAVITWAFGNVFSLTMTPDMFNRLHIFQGYISVDTSLPYPVSVPFPYDTGNVYYQFYSQVDCSGATPSINTPVQLNGISAVPTVPIDFSNHHVGDAGPPGIWTPRIIGDTIYAGCVWSGGSIDNTILTVGCLIGFPLSNPSWSQSTFADISLGTGNIRPLSCPISGPILVPTPIPPPPSTEPAYWFGT